MCVVYHLVFVLSPHLLTKRLPSNKPPSICPGFQIRARALIFDKLMQITTTGSHEAQDELGNLLVLVASSFTQTDINKLPNKKQAQGRKKGYHSIKIKKILL